MKMRSSILRLPECLFWDTDYDKIDPDKQYMAVITRVFDYGSWDEVLEVIAYYGEKKVNKTLRKVSCLKPHSISLACSLFNLQPIDFKCYTKKLSQRSF